MKILIKITFLILFIVAFSSCESFLVEKPYSFPEASTLFENPKNAELALTGLYDVLNAPNIQGTGDNPLWGRGIHYILGLGNDELIGDLKGLTDPEASIMTSYSFNSESKYLSEAWFGLYVGVNRANSILKYVPNIAEMDSVRKEQMIGEAHFFRAFYLTYLSWVFGGVPLPTDFAVDANAPRKPLSEVYPYIIEDFKLAIQKLPARNTVTGRINKYTAQTMLAKVYLYLASCKENQVGSTLDNEYNKFDFVDQADCYQNCYNLCDSVYKNSGYKLNPNYNYLFIADTKNLKAELISEVIMGVNAGTGGSNEYYSYAYLSGPQGNVNTTGGNYGRLRPLGELALKYNILNDNRALQNITGNTSTTLTQIILNVKYYNANTVASAGNNFCLGKFRQSDPVSRTALGIPTYASTLSFPILRFADLILMYAEASYKVKGNDVDARNLLVDIRKRAALGDATKLEALTLAYQKTDFMEELLDERARELCGESWRRIDLMRLGKLEQVVTNLSTVRIGTTNPNYFYWNVQYASVIKNNFQPYKIWFPIPKRELETNTNLKQNFGY